MKFQLARLVKLFSQLRAEVPAECKNEKRFHVHYNFWNGKGWECAGEWDSAAEADREKRRWEKRADAQVLDTDSAHYHWRCECGARSRGGFSTEFDVKHAAQRHQLGKGGGHPMPATYSTDSM